jgi:hypothetical protein
MQFKFCYPSVPDINYSTVSFFSVIKLFEFFFVRIKFILVDQIKKTTDRTQIELHSISYLKRKINQCKPYIHLVNATVEKLPFYRPTLAAPMKKK